MSVCLSVGQSGMFRFVPVSGLLGDRQGSGLVKGFSDEVQVPRYKWALAGIVSRKQCGRRVRLTSGLLYRLTRSPPNRQDLTRKTRTIARRKFPLLRTLPSLEFC